MKAVLNKLIVETKVVLSPLTNETGERAIKREDSDTSKYYKGVVKSKGKDVTDEIQVGDTVRFDFELVQRRAFDRQVINDLECTFYLTLEEREIAYKD